MSEPIRPYCTIELDEPWHTVWLTYQGAVRWVAPDQVIHTGVQTAADCGGGESPRVLIIDDQTNEEVWTHPRHVRPVRYTDTDA